MALLSLLSLLFWPCCVLRALSHGALQPPSTRGGMGVAQAGPPEHACGGKDQETCACACDTGSVCPRGCVTVPCVRQHAPRVCTSLCVCACVFLCGRPTPAGHAGERGVGGMRVCQAWGARRVPASAAGPAEAAERGRLAAATAPGQRSPAQLLHLPAAGPAQPWEQ